MSALQVDVPYNPLKILKNVFKPVMRAATDTGIFARSSAPSLADAPSLSAETQRQLQADPSPPKRPLNSLPLPAQLPLNMPLRAQSKSSEIRNFFHLPNEEMLVDEFYCALRKRVLLQGSLYVFDHYVCFSSNVFGYTKKKVIAFKDVVAVRKKTHCRFPNSLEFEDRDGQKEFFTSFLSRDDANKVIVSCWSQSLAIGLLSTLPPSPGGKLTYRRSASIPGDDQTQHRGATGASGAAGEPCSGGEQKGLLTQGTTPTTSGTLLGMEQLGERADEGSDSDDGALLPGRDAAALLPAAGCDAVYLTS
ncbi:MAG: hypothetical protein WDW38_002829 [Sanguina aurantia]